MSERERLWIEEFNTPWIAFGGLEIDTVERKAAFLMCRASKGDLELILLEIEDAKVHSSRYRSSDLNLAAGCERIDSGRCKIAWSRRRRTPTLPRQREGARAHPAADVPPAERDGSFPPPRSA